MGKLVLLNDVSTEAEEGGLFLGCSDTPASKLGDTQSNTVGVFFNSKVPLIDVIIASDAVRLKRMVHKIRTNSKDQHLTKVNIILLQALRERDFGVLNRTPIKNNSDLFSHSRISAEQGESVLQCRTRVMKCIEELCNKYSDKSILIVSHPLVCQIITNVALQKNLTSRSIFWNEKGSFVILDFNHGKYGLQWKFKNAYNAILDKEYSSEKFHHRLSVE